MPAKNYDVVIIGGGPAGQSVASAAAKAGKTVAITEGFEYGGACPLRGCDPKMVLHAVADCADQHNRLVGKGFPERAKTHWPTLMAWKRSFTRPVPKGSRDKLEGQGVDVYKGWGSFIDEHRVLLGEQEVSGETIIIAAGMKPAPLDIPGFELTYDSADFLDMDELPEELLFIGGGYIGMGFAHIARAMGSKITIIASDPTPLSGFDDDLVRRMRKADEDRGVKFHLRSKVTAVHKTDGPRVRAQVQHEDGTERTIEVDRVIHCAGRVPMLDNLGLENAGVYYSKKGIQVTDRLQTSVSHIYAIGDCTDSGLPLTPVASHEASIVSANLFQHGNRSIGYYPIPTACFTIPQIAAVGMTEEEVKKSDRPITTRHDDGSDWFEAKRLNESVYAYKTFVDDETDEVLGAHLVGPKAAEVINLFALAIHQKIKVSALKTMIWTYPTVSADIGKML